MPAAFQVERIFVAELPVEVADAGDRQHKPPLRPAARLDHLKQRPRQAALAIGGVGRHHLRLPHVERDPAVAPAQPPQAGAGDDRAARPAGVLHDGEVARPHVGKVAVHQDPRHVGAAHVGRIVRAVAKDVAQQVGDAGLVGTRRPAADEPAAKIASVGRVGELSGHKCSLPLHFGILPRLEISESLEGWELLWPSYHLPHFVPPGCCCAR